MTTINRELLRVLRAEIDEALLALGNKHGLALNVGTASFSDTAATFKLTVAVKGAMPAATLKKAA